MNEMWTWVCMKTKLSQNPLSFIMYHTTKNDDVSSKDNIVIDQVFNFLQVIYYCNEANIKMVRSYNTQNNNFDS